MRRSHVYERTVPRARGEMAAPAARLVEVARGISRSLPGIIAVARAAALDSLTDALERARAEAERAMGRPGIVMEG